MSTDIVDSHPVRSDCQFFCPELRELFGCLRGSNELRREITSVKSHMLQRGQRNLWKGTNHARLER
ncbi:unnamed protein product [Tuwongella immobilis]|uniref:Uncharacterized protein n=1 Tax=Tuwongella immobilis TaxID=692036 RepID=A0A6C2YID3_9BACT|nr:unnamed protein product [Tuwongella immobilis]VTR96922.1 unnamed protein product [Tuwongella immobilis]